MQDIHSGKELRAAIVRLEHEHKEDYQLLRQKFHLAYESMKPVNIIRHTLKKTAESYDIKENLLITAVGISTAFLSEKYVVGKSGSLFKKLLSTAVTLGITSMIATHPDAVKSAGRRLLSFIQNLIKARQEARQDAPEESGFAA
jgi:hypothetical protein